jgi:7-keto-8-aminopelargonate synthetase-like enzyme
MGLLGFIFQPHAKGGYLIAHQLFKAFVFANGEPFIFRTQCRQAEVIQYAQIGRRT